MKTKELIKQSIWAGLNEPSITVDAADIVVFGIPYDGSVSFRSGAKDGPPAIREITFSIAPTTECFEELTMKVKDLGDLEFETREQIFDETENLVEKLVHKGKKFTVLGGDHSVTIPVLKGIHRALDKNFGIIHIDAHFDLCDTLEGDRLSHGSTERRALELEHITEESQFFIGIRSVELDELDYMKNHPVQVVSAYEYDQMGTKAVIERVKEKMAIFD